jgi:lysophospholipase L1-like esterase
MKMKRFLQNFALFSIALIVAGVIGEVTLRSFGIYGVRIDDLGPIVMVDDDVVPFRGRPNAEYIDSKYGIPVKRNSKGWRDYEYAYEKKEGVFRIVVLGDSVLNAHGVPQEDVWAKVLEKELNERDPGHFEVIMLSLGALNTTHEAHLLEVEGVKYDPDLVLVGYILNDPAGLPVKTRAKLSSLDNIKLFFKQSSLLLHSWMLLKQTAWQVMDWNLRLTRRGIKNIQTDEYTAIHNDEKKWQGVVNGFRKISRIAAERDIPGVVVIFPLLHKFTQYPWMEVHAKVAEEAKSEGLVAFDLLPTFSGIDEKEVRIGPGDYIHPNSKGHLLAGEAVYNFLVHQDLLENANAAALSQTLKTQQAASNKRAPRQ